MRERLAPSLLHSFIPSLRSSICFVPGPLVGPGDIAMSSTHKNLPLRGFPGGSAPAAAAESRQSCPTLCDPIDGSPPGCLVPGILQARTPEWVAISFSNA